MATFNLSVISDEITKDFGHTVEVVAREFGLGYVDWRGAGTPEASTRQSMAGMKELLQRSGVM